MSTGGLLRAAHEGDHVIWSLATMEETKEHVRSALTLRRMDEETPKCRSRETHNILCKPFSSCTHNNHTNNYRCCSRELFVWRAMTTTDAEKKTLKTLFCRCSLSHPSRKDSRPSNRRWDSDGLDAASLSFFGLLILEFRNHRFVRK